MLQLLGVDGSCPVMPSREQAGDVRNLNSRLPAVAGTNPGWTWQQGCPLPSFMGSRPTGLVAADIHVLLVDDDRLSRLVVGNLLRRCGYVVTTTHGGEEAIRLLQEDASSFNLLVTDVVMPGVDGLQLLRFVRGSPGLMAVPVVLISAHDREDIVFESVLLGADDFLLKPLSKKEVQFIWQHVLRRIRSIHSSDDGFPHQSLSQHTFLTSGTLAYSQALSVRTSTSDQSLLPGSLGISTATIGSVALSISAIADQSVSLSGNSPYQGQTFSDAMQRKTSSLDDADIIGKVFPGLPSIGPTSMQGVVQSGVKENDSFFGRDRRVAAEGLVQRARMLRQVSPSIEAVQDHSRSHTAVSGSGTHRDRSSADIPGEHNSSMAAPDVRCNDSTQSLPLDSPLSQLPNSDIVSGRGSRQPFSVGAIGTSAKAWSFMEDIVFSYPGQGTAADSGSNAASRPAVKVEQDIARHGSEDANGSDELQPKFSQEYKLSSRPVRLPPVPPTGYPEMPPANAHSFRQLEHHSIKRSRRESLSQQILKQQQSYERRAVLQQQKSRLQHYQQQGSGGEDGPVGNICRESAGTSLPSSSNRLEEREDQKEHVALRQNLAHDSQHDAQKISQSRHQPRSLTGVEDPQLAKFSVSSADKDYHSVTVCTDAKIEAECHKSKSDLSGLGEKEQKHCKAPLASETGANGSGVCSEHVKDVGQSSALVVGSTTDDAAGKKTALLVAQPKDPAFRALSGKSGQLTEGQFEGDLTLRQWLNRPSRVVDRLESLHIFRQILEFVNLAHKQGVILRNGRPSCFLLSSLNRVGFMESGSTRGSSDQSSDRSTDVSSTPPLASGQRGYAVEGAQAVQETYVQPPRFIQPVRPSAQQMQAKGGVAGLHGGTGTPCDQQHGRQQPATNDWSGSSASDRSQQRSVKTGEHGYSPVTSSSGGRSDSPGGCNMGAAQNANKDADNCFPQRQLLAMEQAWYSSPEESAGEPAIFGSDIYRLGVLFFELFCTSSSPMDRSRVMSELRHRILPPRLLSECPKEAAFCLWLLHPDPISRPKAGDVLNCELLGEAGEALAEREAAAGIEEKEAETGILMEFLLRLQRQKQDVAQKSSTDVKRLLSDIEEVERRRNILKRKGLPAGLSSSSDHLSKFASKDGGWVSGYGKTPDAFSGKLKPDSDEKKIGVLGKRCREEDQDSNVDLKLKGIACPEALIRRPPELSAKSARLMDNFSQLEKVYFSMRWKAGTPGSESACVSSGHTVEAPLASVKPMQENSASEEQKGMKGRDSEDWLGCFFDDLCKYARYSRFEVKATLRHGDLLNTANMVCSLSFDRDEEFFATAGVCKRIKVFECDAVLNEHVDIHYPVVEMTSRSKLSSVCWNSYIKSHIASSDYEGVVQLWDASTSQTLMEYKEHEKRAWSVDFSRADPTKLASGSDDGCVKLWSINQETSIGTIKTKANVCCVQFPADSAHLLAFGSADYRIFCYDLRNTRMPLCILANHNKAVSYVKFVDSGTLVSASTDNTLKLWDITKASANGGITTTCSLTYTGHTNEKNFVGLTVADGYIVCGAETNSVFAYHKSLPMPMAWHKFGCADPVTGQETEDDGGQFVSSVCWRGKSKMLVAANSMGNIKLLELV